MIPGRVLIIAPRLPEFDRESGLLRVSHLIEMFRSRGWEVTFGCIRTPTDPERYAYVLEQQGVETHAPLESIDEIRDPSSFTLAILAFWHVAERFQPELRRLAPSARIVVDSIDLHFVRDLRDELRYEPGSTPGQLSARHADEFVREVNTYAAADAVLTVSSKEALLINDLVGQPGHAFSLPDTEELPRSPVPLRGRRGILFLGNFRHAPNVDAARYLCEAIVPRLDQSLLAQHELSIVGTAAEEHVRGHSDGLLGVKTVGWVPSVLPYLNSACVSVVPLRYGAGTKRKVIQSLMVGTPTVTTSVGGEGLGLQSGRHVLIADDPHSFATAIESLLLQEPVWRRLARYGRTHVLGLHGRASVEARFEEILESVLDRRARPAVPQPPAAEGAATPSEYAKLVERIREAVEAEVPPGANVLVATRGDEKLLGFERRQGWHFPRDCGGRYAGFNPADSEAAIAHLEQLRTEGATHFVLPETGFWWLGYYDGLHRYLETAFRRLRSDAHVIVYDLTGESAANGEVSEPDRSGIADSNGHLESAAIGDELAARVPGAEEPPVEITPELIRALQPTAIPAAYRHRNAAGGTRALVLGIYLSGRPNTAEHVSAILAGSSVVDTSQRWIALGGDAVSGELGALTSLVVTEPTPKYELLNRLLTLENLDSYDYVVTVDDDIVLAEKFLDLFLGVQKLAGYALAQPARTQNSHVDHPIVLQQRGVLARQTFFVEIGPVVSFGREIYDLVFPFDETNPMGWGFENVWARRLLDADFSEGIVDGVPVDHSVRAPVAYYEWSDAVADRERYLARNPHLPLEQCFRVLEVVRADR